MNTPQVTTAAAVTFLVLLTIAVVIILAAGLGSDLPTGYHPKYSN
jgi:hypothetical protein